MTRHPKILACVMALCGLSVPACEKVEEPTHVEHRTILVSSPAVQDVTITEQYVCQIHSRRHIEVRSLEGGYLEEIPVQEGQAVRQGDVMFKILPSLHQAKLSAEVAEAQLARIEFENANKLYKRGVVSDQDVALAQAKLAKAEAQMQLSRTELDFTQIRAPFDGIIDRLHEQQGSLIEEGDMLTSLSDNQVMWVYFNVPEVRYLEYAESIGPSRKVKGLAEDEWRNGDDVGGGSDERRPNNDDYLDDEGQGHPRLEDLKIELVLANGNKFAQPGVISAIEGEFNSETGNIAFRADFPNPDGVLRHGQTGTLLIHRVLNDAVVIPQRATFQILDKRYVFVIGEDQVAHQHEITIAEELEDIYVVSEGVKPGDKFVLEGSRDVRDGDKVDEETSEFHPPEEVLKNLKHHAE